MILPGSIIKNIKNTRCGWDEKPLGKPIGGQKGHSHKELMRCLYRSNIELRNAIVKEGQLNDKIKGLEGELGQYVVKEELAKENKGTGLLQPNPKESINPFQKQPDALDEIINAPPLDILKDKTKNDKELAKNLIEAESVVDGNTK